jgi:trimethyllysine dioxygenase
MAKRTSDSFVRLLATYRDHADEESDHHFLYDHCRCPKCFHSQTKQRLKTLTDVPLDIAPESVEYSDSGINIRWPTTGGHESFFPFSFLSKAAYDPPVAGDQVEST